MSRSIKYFRAKRMLLKNCVASIIKCISPQDPRPHAEVTIVSQKLIGLLDSGASVSVLGKNSL